MPALNFLKFVGRGLDKIKKYAIIRLNKLMDTLK
jgi:hypothetical protein